MGKGVTGAESADKDLARGAGANRGLGGDEVLVKIDAERGASKGTSLFEDKRTGDCGGQHHRMRCSATC